jgi:hypothetical protein
MYLNAKKMKNMIPYQRNAFVQMDIIKLEEFVKHARKMKFINLKFKFVGEFAILMKIILCL